MGGTERANCVWPTASRQLRLANCVLGPTASEPTASGQLHAVGETQLAPRRSWPQDAVGSDAVGQTQLARRSWPDAVDPYCGWKAAFEKNSFATNTVIMHCWEPQKYFINSRIPITVYSSNRTQIKIVFAEWSSPTVEARISFLTEPSNNEGTTHALEHLIYCGSSSYKRGTLDLVANGCLACELNAVTEDDCTVYKIRTAGNKGFVKLFSVFLDHLLHPNLEEQSYWSEVHNVNTHGKDEGVMFAEMQARESTLWEIADRKRREMMYPESNGYRYKAGGVLDEIRNLTVEKVKEFHNIYYNCNNMYITICGQIEHNELLVSIGNIEGQNIPLVPFITPFQVRVSPLTGQKMERIDFPSLNESTGMVQMSWHGPPGSDFRTTQALIILVEFLTYSSNASLQKHFVQTNEPFCMSANICVTEQIDCEIIAYFEGVPVDKLSKIQERFFEKIHVAHQEAGAFNLPAIRSILDQQIRELHCDRENHFPSLVSSAVISSQLFDKNCEMLEKRLNQDVLFEELKNEQPQFWHDLFQKFFIKNCVCLMAEPSEQMANDYEKKERERIQQQLINIGEDELKKRAKKMDDAINEYKQHAQLSDEDLARLTVSELEEFNMIEVSTKHHWLKTTDGYPYPAFLHNINSDFFEAIVLIDTDPIPVNLRHYLMLWCQLLFQSGARIDDAGQQAERYEVARQSTKALVSHSVSLGISGIYDRFIALRLKTTAENFSELKRWTKTYLTGVVFDRDRVMFAARNLANKAEDRKMNGDSVCHFMDACSAYLQDGNTHFHSYLGLEKFHREVAEEMRTGPGDEVLAKLEDLRTRLLMAPMNVHFGGNPDRIQLSSGASSAASPPIAEIAEEWGWAFTGKKDPSLPELKCPADYKASDAQFGQSCAILVECSPDSAFLLQRAKFDDDWSGSSTMATLLLAQHLQQSEGPLWKAVRGTGLAYGVNLYVMPDRKALSLELDRCSQLSRAHKVTRETILEVLGNKLDQRLFESAKHSLVSVLISGLSTVELTITSAVLATIRSINNDFTNNLCTQIWQAKAEDVLAKGGPQIRRLLEPEQSFCSIALNPLRKDELKENFPKTKLISLDELQVVTL
ncbi:hypothetical protein niasHT_034608 [Heterodera trifolii]|uniref:Uncharacterized protein n=1 Tax=Heterodera trifolii TaxID=157864 RepID=A0ABD2IR46_9BILA